MRTIALKQFSKGVIRKINGPKTMPRECLKMIKDGDTGFHSNRNKWKIPILIFKSVTKLIGQKKAGQ